nr:immunoglobulin heavy chain junction region [Macaca mulatta]
CVSLSKATGRFDSW